MEQTETLVALHNVHEDKLRRTLELDEATYWVYASEKGIRVFCIYGIGDGADNTPLYASGGMTAEADAAKFNRYLEGYDNGTDEGREVLNRWVEDMRSAKRNVGGNLHDPANRRADVGDVRASGGAQRSIGRGAVERGKSNRGGEVKPKFSMETPVEQTETLIALHNMHEEKFSRELDMNQAAERAQSYTYEALTAKPDMKITEIDNTVQYSADSKTRKQIVKQAQKNAAIIGKTDENGGVWVHVDDLRDDVLYSVNAKKESAVLNAPESADNPLLVTDSTISIAQLLDLARDNFPDIHADES